MIESLVTGVALGHAVLTVFVAAWALWVYRKSDGFSQLAFLLAGYCILSVLVATGLVRYWDDPWWINNFRTPASIIAFGLCDFGLLRLIMRSR